MTTPSAAENSQLKIFASNSFMIVRGYYPSGGGAYVRRYLIRKLPFIHFRRHFIFASIDQAYGRGLIKNTSQSGFRAAFTFMFLIVYLNLPSIVKMLTIKSILKTRTGEDNQHVSNNRVSFLSESGQIVLDESFLKKKVNKREFDFFGFNDNFELIPVKMASSYEVMTTIVLFDRMIKS